jgi:hypothetical protein
VEKEKNMNNQKNKMNHQPGFLAASWDAWQAAREGTRGIARRQQERLAALVSYARAHSRYFAVLYREVPEPPQLHPKSGKFQQVWSEVKQCSSAGLLMGFSRHG